MSEPTTTPAGPTTSSTDRGAPAVAVEDLTIRFATDGAPVDAVRGVSLHVDPGEILAIVGESGSGKTVTARTVLRLLPETATVEGAVILAGHDVLTLSGSQLRAARGRDVAMVFQEPSTALNPVYTVGWQIAEGLRAHGKVSRKQARARAIEILAKVGIPDPADAVHKYPHQFSGGQKQRIVIAMALVLGPKVVVADEPTTALDVTVQAEILDLLRHVRDEFGTAIILITHNMGVVADLADRVAVMNQGLIVETAPARELFANPREDYTRQLLAAVPRLLTSGSGSAPARAAARATARDAAQVGTGTAEAPRGRGEAGEVVVEARGLDITYPGRLGRPGFRALKDADMRLARGEVLGLVGESGSGKTTLGRAIAGLTRATGGSLKVLGCEMVGVRERDFHPVRPQIGFVFQDPAASFNPRMTIGECVAEPLVVHGLPITETDGRRPDGSRIPGSDTAAVARRVAHVLDAVHLPQSFARRFPHELSGGQRQRASLARALALDPQVLIADEPTSALDVSVQARVLEVFAELQERLGFATLFITHDLAVVGMLADRLAVMHQGRIVETGPAHQVLTGPREPYTRRLLASVPVPDPVEQARRREALAALTAR